MIAMAGGPMDDHLSEAVVSLGNLRHNLACIREKLSPACRVMAIVKANAYGHGACETTAALETEGVRDFGVANIHEAIELRQGHAMHRDSRILAFASPLPRHIGLYLEHDIDMTVCDAATVRAAEAVASAAGSRLRVQVKVDTGMGRLGMAPDEASEMIDALNASTHVEPVGIYTHFAESHNPDGYTDLQLRRFISVTRAIEEGTRKRLVRHAANSGAIVSKAEAHLDMVRPGILLYGCHPVDARPCGLPVKPVMQFQGKVMFVKDLPQGATVSYNRTWAAPEATRVATVAAGYADGYHRSLSNRATVFVNGCACPQVGMVTMDQIMVDVGSCGNIRPGDTAVLFGWEGPTAGELAILAGTISYELLCSVSRRVRRIYR